METEFRAIQAPPNIISAIYLVLRTAIGAQNFLFFRYNSLAAVIIYAWVNDESTLRTAGASNDPYHVFVRMLRKGEPPDDWNALIKEARVYT